MSVLILITYISVGLYLGRCIIVLQESLKLIDEIQSLSNEDVENHRPWKWRFEKFKAVNKFELYFKILTPVRNIYAKTGCLQKLPGRGKIELIERKDL